MNWKRSSHSPIGAGAVEVTEDCDRILVRASGGSPIIWFTEQEWDDFLVGVKSGEFDLKEE
jgi:Domain of unknown function (DUF397)